METVIGVDDADVGHHRLGGAGSHVDRPEGSHSSAYLRNPLRPLFP
jgi:hypothetical protein